MILSIVFFGYEWENLFWFLLGPLSLFITIYTIFETDKKKKYIFYSISLIFFVFFLVKAKTPSRVEIQIYSNKVLCLEEIESQIAVIINKEKKPMILYFYATWCHSCEHIEEKLSRKEVGELIQKGWIFIKVDVSDYEKYEEHLLKHYGVYGVPALAFFDKEGNIVKPFTMVGEEIPIRTLISILRQFGVFENPI